MPLVFNIARTHSLQKIRNFCIIAHIDHGKSTLADRLLQITDIIPRGSRSQFLDNLQVQKQRGITVKAKTCTMKYKEYLLNLVDTPGHCDFSYEVKRSMRSCQGALLVVDATQGVQAQTVTNYQHAKAQGLKIIPVINKIDMPSANPAQVAQQIKAQLKLQTVPLLVSAKTGSGIQKLLETIVQEIASPAEWPQKELTLFLVNSWYQKNKGVICLFLVKSGTIKKGLTIASANLNRTYQVFEVGVLNPNMEPVEQLRPGMIGYVATNMKQVSEARIGDTFYRIGKPVKPLTGFQPAKPVVFAGLYSVNPNNTPQLQKNLYRLALMDPSVKISKESSAALGSGFKVGFLGVLHMQIFRQRLQAQFGSSDIIITSPSVPYRCRTRKGQMLLLENASQCPEKGQVDYIQEQMVKAKVIVPIQVVKQVQSMCQNKRGKQLSRSEQGSKGILLYRLPLSEVILNFSNQIKSMSKGYGSMDFQLDGFQKSNIEKVIIHIMGDPIDALTFMVHKSKAFEFSKRICVKLKERIPQQLFAVSIQAKVGSKVIAKQQIGHFKKHVTAKCYGGDYSRKQKLIDRYMQGKKQLRRLGKVEIDKDTFLGILSE